MRHILDSLNAEFITVHDDGKKYVLKTWHVMIAIFVIGWLIG